MNILKLEIENYKKLKAFKEELNGRNMPIAGPAGVGKTTAISALWDIIETVGEPLTKGEKKGHIKIVLGDGDKNIIAKREFTPKTNTPIILTSEGDKLTMAEFKKFYSSLGVNPQDILNQKPKEFLKTVLSATKQPEGMDIEAIEKELNSEEAERTLLFREYERAKKSLPPEPEAVQEVIVDELYKELEAERAKETQLQDLKNDLTWIADKGQGIKREIDREKESVKEIEDQIEELKKKLEEKRGFIKQSEAQKETIKEEYSKKQSDLESFPAPDLQSIQAKIQEAQNINNKAKRYQEWVKQNEALNKADKSYRNQVENIKTLQTKLKEAMDKSEFPLKGLSVKEGKIYYEDILVDNLGTSKKNLVSAALAAEIIDKEDRLRAVRMDGVESMDENDFKEMQKIFNDKGIQVLSSRVIRKQEEAEDYEIVIEEQTEEEKDADI